MRLHSLTLILVFSQFWSLFGGIDAKPEPEKKSCRILPEETADMPQWNKNAEYLILHFFTEQEGVLEISLKSKEGEGAFEETVPYSAGEQFKLLPLKNFRRIGKPSWNALNSIVIQLEKGKKVSFLGSFFSETQTIPSPGIVLIQRVNEITPIGTAYPLYRIVSRESYPKHLKREEDALQRHLKTLTGVLLPQIQKPQSPYNSIFLGKEGSFPNGAFPKNEWKRQGFNGFAIKIHQSNLMIASESIQGGAYGIYRFLEAQGMKFFARGIHTPVRKNNHLSWLETEDRPFFNGKRMPGPWCIYGDESNFALADPRQAGIDEVFPGDKTQWIDHTSAFLVPKKYYYDKHPEYYSLRADGTRMPKDTQDVRVMLCQTNPGGIRTAAERALQWIRSNPQHLMYAVQQGDDSESCVCTGCEAKRNAGWNETDLFLNWVNGIAEVVGKEFPDHYLLCYAYISTQPAPKHLKPAPNVQLLYAPWPNRLSAPNGFRDFDAPENIVAGTQLKDWTMISNPEQLGIYDYPSGNSLTHRGMAHRLKWLARRNMRGSIWYCGVNRVFAPMFAYVQARLCWNPLLDTRALENEFIEGYYGKAGGVMKKIISSVYDRLDSDPANSGRVPSRTFFSKEYVDALIRDFAEARKLASKPLSEELLSDESGILENGLYACSENPASAAGAALWKRYLEIAAENPRTNWKTVCDLLWSAAKIRCSAEKSNSPPSLVPELIREPQKTIALHRQTNFVEKRLNGIFLQAYAFEGGTPPVYYNWKCEGRVAVGIRGTMTEQYRMKAVFPLDSVVPSELVFEGQSCDKLSVLPVPIRIMINGQTIFEGVNGCRKQGWTLRTIRIPDGILKPGNNEIVFENQAKSDSRVSHWFLIAGAEIREARK